MSISSCQLNNTTILNGKERLQQILSSRTTFDVVLESFIYGFFVALALFGNLLVLFVVYKSPRLRNAAGVLVTSLAISDVAMALFESPHTLSSLIAGRWVGSFALCQFTGFTIICLACTSLQTMSLMALDRYYRIFHPVKHRSFFSTKRAKFMAVLIWFVSTTVHIPYVASGGLYMFHPGKGFCFPDSSLLASLVYIYGSIPLGVLPFCYLKIFLRLRNNQRRLRNSLQEKNDSMNLTVEEIKLTRTLFVTMVGYMSCWLPVIIIDFVDMIIGGWALPRMVYVVYNDCAMASSSINPIIYGAMNRTFRKEYIKFFRGRRNSVVTRECQVKRNAWIMGESQISNGFTSPSQLHPPRSSNFQ